jgi:hypothetical protein
VIPGLEAWREIFRQDLISKRTMTEPASPRWDSEVRLLAWLATCVSVFSFLFYYRNGEVLLYGDAIAHINIARRVFDSKTPGLLQLGTVWLPLPHLLMIPFLLYKPMWQNGVGGSLPSMIAYVFGVLGIFRLVRGLLSGDKEPPAAARVAAWTAAIVYAANPNLIYMQATAMGESLYLALFVWVMVFFAEFSRGDSKALTKCGLCLAAACWTRYDGWFLTITIIAAVAAMASLAIVRSKGVNSQPLKKTVPKAIGNVKSRITMSCITKFVLIAAAAPALWLAYNGIVYRNPLEFANGPYSARAIEKRTQSAGSAGHPGAGKPALAGQYFLKSAQVNMAANIWLQRLWIVLGLLALALAGLVRPREQGGKSLLGRTFLLPIAFLLVPVPFYALSIAYGGVPIFIPAWWPFSHYNVRYGLQMLPAFAVAAAFLAYWALSAERWTCKVRLACASAVAALVLASYASIWRTDPICLSEATINMRGRNQLERQLATWLKSLPADSTLLMYVGDHVGALQLAGIPLEHTINEGNHRVWMQPTDPDGLWERALASPTNHADYVIAFEGDPVWQSVRALRLPEVAEIHVTSQARAVVYRAR